MAAAETLLGTTCHPRFAVWFFTSSSGFAASEEDGGVRQDALRSWPLVVQSRDSQLLMSTVFQSVLADGVHLYDLIFLCLASKSVP